MKQNLHLNLKAAALLDGVGDGTLRVKHRKIHNLGDFLPVFQGIGVHLEIGLPASLDLLGYNLAAFFLPVRIDRVLVNQKLLVHVHHGFGTSLV